MLGSFDRSAHRSRNKKSERRPFVLLDRDGTIVEERHYLSSPEQLRLLKGAASGLRALKSAGFGLVVITNQSGVARGFFNEQQLHQIHRALTHMLAAHGVLLDGIYYCPHHPSDQCACRKPKTALVEAAARHHGFALERAVVIGDKPCDIALGKNAGTRTILVRTGYGGGGEPAGDAAPDFVVDDLLDASRLLQTIYGQATTQVKHEHAYEPH